ncbi:hypothetical protein [Saccharothrix variisporea]|uniref:DUF3291 domain-containing protein n=1 Tax=Saccharothrix variisporea TaxID=543527 RepID=A0A495X094_9PSEU|nr:hypothetical protein [Saccharothrix variisporea]RKT67237.1 hypothetical protein DFJ66_0409 [Saccharothrix variisporea]
MLRTGWQAGPASGGPVLVAVTDFHATRRRDLLAVARAGRSLANAWPSMPGAVGMWLWTMPLAGRSGSVSVWTSEDALKSFVRRPPHTQIVRRFANAGTLHTHRWWMPEFDRDQAWRTSREHLVPKK